MMEQLELAPDLVEQFALSDRALMYAQGRNGSVRLAPANFKAPKWDMDVYQYETYTRERGYHTATVRLDFMARAREPWRPPARKAFTEPTGYEVGATVEFQPRWVGGGNLTGQVWCRAQRPNCVWVASGSSYYLVDARDGTTIDMWDGRIPR